LRAVAEGFYLRFFAGIFFMATLLRHSFAKYVLFLLFTGLSAYVLTECLLYSQNTIWNNDQWLVGKRLPQVRVVGGIEFEVSRSSLSGNTLNLHDWHGFQEVFTKEDKVPFSVSFDAFLQPAAYLDIIFNRTSRGGLGIRLFRSSEKDSFVFEFDAHGKFAKKSEFVLPPLVPGWNRISVEGPNGQQSKITLKINRQLVYDFAGAFKAGAVGFRGSRLEAAIDNVSILYQDHSQLTEAFSNEQPAGKIYFFNFILISIFYSILAMARPVMPLPGSAWVRVAITGLVIFSAWYIFDRYYWSRQQFINFSLNKEKSLTAVERVEKFRQDLFRNWYESATSISLAKDFDFRERDKSTYITEGPIYCVSVRENCLLGSKVNVAPKRDGQLRLLLMGGSFAVGAGANRLEDSFFVRAHRQVQAQLAPRVELQSLNIAKADKYPPLGKQALDEVFAFQPDLILVEVPMTREVAREVALSWVKALEEAGEKVLRLETRDSPMKNRTRKMNGSAKRAVDLSSHLQHAEDAGLGFIFWDSIHLTSYGSSLAAEWLVPKILDGLKK
jgi:hypothetical protein